MPNESQDLASLLRERPHWHAWVMRYNISPSSKMLLALHDGGYLHRVELICLDCERFEGELRGGPYRFELVNLSDASGTERIELRDRDGAFRLVCGRIDIGMNNSVNPSMVALSGDEIEGLALIRQAVMECAQLDGEALAARYAQIGDILRGNANRLALDEEINNLMAFARCLGCAAMSAESQRAHWPSGCWSFDPLRKLGPNFIVKREGHNNPSSAVLPRKRQQSGMMSVLLTHMGNDPSLAAGVHKLQQYRESLGLWSNADNNLLWA